MATKNHNVGYDATCEPCGKRLYRSRKIAQAMAKRIPGDRMATYRCPHSAGWHLGHLPSSVRQGTYDRDSYRALLRWREGQ